jgi:hypothetical protein
MIMNWAGVQLVIFTTVDRPGGATWKQIKSAIEAEGWTPTDWLTQVRGPLQGMIQEGVIRRVDYEAGSEHYELAPKDD